MVSDRWRECCDEYQIDGRNFIGGGEFQIGGGNVFGKYQIGGGNFIGEYQIGGGNVIREYQIGGWSIIGEYQIGGGNFTWEYQIVLDNWYQILCWQKLVGE